MRYRPGLRGTEADEEYNMTSVKEAVIKGRGGLRQELSERYRPGFRGTEANEGYNMTSVKEADIKGRGGLRQGLNERQTDRQRRDL